MITMPFFQLHVLSSQIKIQERYSFALPELPLISSQPQMIIFLPPLFLFLFLRNLLLLILNSIKSILYLAVSSLDKIVSFISARLSV